jgi:pimeloyl-ACP methyl ester carboxylesterase
VSDRLHRTSSLISRRAQVLLTPAGLRGAGVEIAWTAAHIASYPMGVLRERFRPEDRYSLDRLSPVKRGLVLGDVEAAGTPIVLVHGWIDNRSIFTFLRRSLQRRGFGRIATMNYGALTHDVHKAARRLQALIEQVCAETGYERVHVVGHSLGGLVARYYVQRLGGDDRVHTLATLGTPHAGTLAAQVIPIGKVARQLRPDSPVIRELAEPAPACRTRFIAFYSDLDQLIVPNESARIDHPDLDARNVLVRGVGHLSLPISGRVVQEIVAAFAHLDSDGSTLTPAVTTIDLVGRPDGKSTSEGNASGQTSSRRPPRAL